MSADFWDGTERATPRSCSVANLQGITGSSLSCFSLAGHLFKLLRMTTCIYSIVIVCNHLMELSLVTSFSVKLSQVFPEGAVSYASTLYILLRHFLHCLYFYGHVFFSPAEPWTLWRQKLNLTIASSTPNIVNYGNGSINSRLILQIIRVYGAFIIIIRIFSKGLLNRVTVKHGFHVLYFLCISI